MRLGCEPIAPRVPNEPSGLLAHFMHEEFEVKFEIKISIDKRVALVLIAAVLKYLLS